LLLLLYGEKWCLKNHQAMLVQIKMKMMAAIRRNNGASLGEHFVHRLHMQDGGRWLSIRDGYANHIWVSDAIRVSLWAGLIQ
jgi:hypothetical protein